MSDASTNDDVQAFLNATNRLRTIKEKLVNKEMKTVDISDFKKLSSDMYGFLLNRGLINENREWSYWLFFFAPIIMWTLKIIMHKLALPNCVDFQNLFDSIKRVFNFDFDEAIRVRFQPNAVEPSHASLVERTLNHYSIISLCDIVEEITLVPEISKSNVKVVLNALLLQNSYLAEKLGETKGLDTILGEQMDFINSISIVNNISDLLTEYLCSRE